MKTVVYALGGGRGHLQRALNLRGRWPEACILHQSEPTPGTIALGRCTPAEVRQHLVGVDRLVVDTFPGGIAGELELPDCETVLIARYVTRHTYPRYDALVERFDTVLLPYEAARSEWDDPPRGTFIGPVRRSIRWRGETDLLVVGSGEPPSWTPLLAHGHRVDGPFDSLPRPRAIVALQAGYNLFWELVDTGIPSAFRPLPRRFDDQFRRVGRFGTGLLHRSDLEAFLARSGLLIECPR